MKYPEKPDLPNDPRKSLPNYRRDCPECGNDDDYYDHQSESEEIGTQTYRCDYWCNDCDEHIGTKVDYEGPVPVQIGPDTHELQ